MIHIRLPLCLLAAAITAGCAGTDKQYQGSPFDEPVAYSRPQQIPQTVTQVRELPVVEPSIQPPQNIAPEVVESDVQVFAAGSAPYSTISTPSLDPVPASTATSTDPADEILAEARKVGTSGDVPSQIGLLEQAGFLGSGQAFYELARVYLNGEGVKKDPETAVGYLTKAAGMEHVESIRVLGWLYLLGTGVPKDVAYGEQLLAKAAETSVRAQREFGQALTNQRLPHLNQMERGLEMLKQAADAGDAEASKAYAKAFSPGSNTTTAATPVSNEQGPASASSASSRQSVRDGGEELKQRGLTGDAEALYQYALNVSLGKIPAADPQFTAYCWYSVSSAMGYKPASEEVRSLAGVKTIADKQSPGRMESCIGDLNRTISGS
ncbi:tetratricopeptide repeat protein [Pseudomonas baetica]|uniref:tetratricopeptide repeat protein n=1 Tax=Pseudomonas baetica TaxID=674054 RepID=UPI0024058D16|nr:tetratricopeptide repeat protein [Pseudomonas baetica]MDF9779128.1 TPR repeat protein [Pseudomonas baetica]